MKRLFTSESVSEGHPDKICDQISDAILDACLEQDPYSKVACEVFACDQNIIIGGEITTNAKVNYEEIARNVIKRIGYNDSKTAIDFESVKIQIILNTQSPDIARGVEREKEIGAGDQGMMFGYATNETKNYMPYAISIAHDLVHLASKLRKSGHFKWARPDMKSQVTMDYTNAISPRIETILMSIQHDVDFNEDEFKKYIKENIMNVIARRYDQNTDFEVLINPTGRFIIGGPKGDTGLTGRKIIVDSYGGFARHGGGAFSGKDGTKVDRSAAYMCRYAAKNLVAAGFADQIEIQVSYAIGIAKPVSIYIETFGTEKVSFDLIRKALNENFDFSVKNIIETLQLRKPVYFRTSKYGHFGKEEFLWEKLDKVAKLKGYL